jgi:hypothetical protein
MKSVLGTPDANKEMSRNSRVFPTACRDPCSKLAPIKTKLLFTSSYSEHHPRALCFRLPSSIMRQ